MNVWACHNFTSPYPLLCYCSLCLRPHHMSSPLLSSPLNLAWANRTLGGWHCICGERLSILAGPDTQTFAIHCQGKKHRAGISILEKPQRQLAMTQFVSAAPARASEASEPPPHDSDREDDIETSAIESQSSSLPKSCNEMQRSTPARCSKCQCAASTQLCAMHMRRSIGGMWTGWGFTQWTPPVPERLALVTPVNNCPVFHVRQCPVTQQCASGCARNKMWISARHISSECRGSGTN